MKLDVYMGAGKKKKWLVPVRQGLMMSDASGNDRIFFRKFFMGG